MERLGRNHNGYHGETIDIQSVLRDVEAAAQQHGWFTEVFHHTPALRLTALHRPARSPGASHPVPRAYISTGIHGDEPAGPLAVRRLLQEERWPPGLELWVCPCLNPKGFELNRRENEHGIDLNRQYRQPQAAEIVSHAAWLDRQPAFDLCLCLHEDWESHGFYLYELNPDSRPSLAEKIVERIATVCPIDLSEVIEERPAKGGIVRPSVDPRTRPEWPEAFYLLMRKTRVSLTLEAPSDFPLATRVAALVTGVNAALEAMAARAG